MSKNVFTFENNMKDINQSQEVVKTETSVGYEQQQEKKEKVSS